MDKYEAEIEYKTTEQMLEEGYLLSRPMIVRDCDGNFSLIPGKRIEIDDSK